MTETELPNDAPPPEIEADETRVPTRCGFKTVNERLRVTFWRHGQIVDCEVGVTGERALEIARIMLCRTDYLEAGDRIDIELDIQPIRLPATVDDATSKLRPGAKP